MRSDKGGRQNGRCRESGAGAGAGAGVGLSHAIRRGRDRRGRAQGVPGFGATLRPFADAAIEIAWRLLGLLAMAICVTGGVFLLTVLFLALN